MLRPMTQSRTLHKNAKLNAIRCLFTEHIFLNSKQMNFSYWSYVLASCMCRCNVGQNAGLYGLTFTWRGDNEWEKVGVGMADPLEMYLCVLWHGISYHIHPAHQLWAAARYWFNALRYVCTRVLTARNTVKLTNQNRARQMQWCRNEADSSWNRKLGCWPAHWHAMSLNG